MEHAWSGGRFEYLLDCVMRIKNAVLGTLFCFIL